MIYRFLSFIFCVPLSSFGIRVMLASWNELVIPSPPFLFLQHSFGEIPVCIPYVLYLLHHFPVWGFGNQELFTWGFFFLVLFLKMLLNCRSPQDIPGSSCVFPVPHLESAIASSFFLLENRVRILWMGHDPVCLTSFWVNQGMANLFPSLLF